jgi:hypothetical protein
MGTWSRYGDRTRPIRAVVLAAALAAACGRNPRPVAVAPYVAAGRGGEALRLPSVWTFPGSEVPAFCLVLLPEGRAVFQGGMLYLNPARWSYAADHRFSLSVPALRDSDTPALLAHVSEGQLLGYDSTTRTMVLALHPEAAAMPLLGYVLVPPSGLQRSQLNALRSRCPALPR